MYSGLFEVEIEGEERTAIKFMVQPRDSGTWFWRRAVISRYIGDNLAIYIYQDRIWSGGGGMSPDNQERDLEFITRIKRSEDPAAKEDLVRKYLPMVKHIVRKNIISTPGEYEDLLQEGVIGLLKAINKYNHELYSIKFSTFAYICILRKIYNARRQSEYRKPADTRSHLVLPGDCRKAPGFSWI